MKINTDKNCNIVITDDTEYPFNEIEYSESASLYIAQLNRYGRSTIIYSKLDPHTNSAGTPIVLQPQEGGFITVCHILLPKGNVNDFDPRAYTEKYVKVKNFIRNSQIDILFGFDIPDGSLYDSNNDDSDSSEEDIIGVYFTDGVSIYYKDIQGTVRAVEFQELLEVNPNTFALIRFMQNFFSVCYLRKCYVSLCQKIFKDRGFDRCFNGKVNSQLIYKRDLVWAALNVIQYMVDSNQLTEAQRLLERINGCNGLCSSEDTGEKGCGCDSWDAAGAVQA